MKIAFPSAIFCLAIFAASCVKAASPTYTVNVPLTSDEDGLMAYLTDYDTGARIDSVVVTDGQAVFTGTIDVPVLARVYVDGNRLGMLVLEGGEITLQQSASGTPLNDWMVNFNKAQADLLRQYRSLAVEDTIERQRLMDKGEELMEEALATNANNPLGLYFFLQNAYEMDLPALEAALAHYPQFGKSQKLADLKASKTKEAETAVGQMYKDFTITYRDSTQSLSDYVGNGHYTLVDFWASWCGPCRREMPTLKEIAATYADKLDVLGVAVWDEPQNTERAIEELEIPWPVIMNAQTIPTDIYGISGIPCIILINPEGKIVSRGKQGQELLDDVAAIVGAE